MAACPDEATLLALVERKLTRLLATPLQRHIDSCRACQLAAAEAARTIASSHSTTTSSVQRELRPGAVLDARFELLAPIGQGGAGTVWSARRTEDGAELAIKVLRDMEPEQARRLAREARLSQRVAQHPAFVPIHEVLILDGGRPALVMDLLRGEDLAAHLDSRDALTADEAVPILAPLADALVTLHAERIAHRDLKPANVFLQRNDAGAVSPRILDLGMARSLSLEQSTLGSRLTAEGTILGTPRYMAPEQLYGSREVDTCADIWAFGAIAYRMLSGRPHLTAWRLAEVVRSLHFTPIPALSSVAPHTAVELARLVDASLSIKPEQRPTARDWVEQLRGLMPDGGASASV